VYDFITTLLLLGSKGGGGSGGGSALRVVCTPSMDQSLEMLTALSAVLRWVLQQHALPEAACRQQQQQQQGQQGQQGKQQPSAVSLAELASMCQAHSRQLPRPAQPAAPALLEPVVRLEDAFLASSGQGRHAGLVLLRHRDMPAALVQVGACVWRGILEPCPMCRRALRSLLAPMLPATVPAGQRQAAPGDCSGAARQQLRRRHCGPRWRRQPGCGSGGQGGFCPGCAAQQHAAERRRRRQQRAASQAPGG
jgi:hypothetical protein